MTEKSADGVSGAHWHVRGKCKKARQRVNVFAQIFCLSWLIRVVSDVSGLRLWRNCKRRLSKRLSWLIRVVSKIVLVAP
jgi:hypothetical protein